MRGSLEPKSKERAMELGFSNGMDVGGKRIWRSGDNSLQTGRPRFNGLMMPAEAFMVEVPG